MSKKNGYVYALKFQFLTAFYDTLIARFMPEQEMREKVAERTQPGHRSRVLDIGCGTGTLTVLMAKKYPSAFVAGIDGDQKILKQALEKSKQNGVTVNLGIAFAESLPFKNESFEHATSSLVFHHLTPEAKTQALLEIKRILKSRGKFLLMDWGKPANVFMKILFFIVRVVDGFENTEANAEGKLPQIMQEAGFSSIIKTYEKNTIMGTVALYEGNKL